MRYQLQIEIEAPREQVVERLINPENMAMWQPSLLAFKVIAGTPGSQGARTRLRHKMGRREVEMTETIESAELPEMFTAIYEAKNAWNRVINRFEAVNESRTIWHFDSEFKCSGILRIMTALMPSMFKSQSKKDLQNFKRFCESRREDA